MLKPLRNIDPVRVLVINDRGKPEKVIERRLYVEVDADGMPTEGGGAWVSDDFYYRVSCSRVRRGEKSFAGKIRVYPPLKMFLPSDRPTQKATIDRLQAGGLDYIHIVPLPPPPPELTEEEKQARADRDARFAESLRNSLVGRMRRRKAERRAK